MKDRSSPGRRVRLIMAALALAAFGTLGTAAFVFLREEWRADPLGGEWEGSGFRKLMLEKVLFGGYVGTYTGTRSGKPGKVKLRRAAGPNRWEGTWSDGQNGRGTFEVTANPESGMLTGTCSLDPEFRNRPDSPSTKPFTLFRPGEAAIFREMNAEEPPFMSLLGSGCISGVGYCRGVK